MKDGESNDDFINDSKKIEINVDKFDNALKNFILTIKDRFFHENKEIQVESKSKDVNHSFSHNKIKLNIEAIKQALQDAKNTNINYDDDSKK